LAVTIDDTQIQRFPEANNTRILLPWNCYNFSIGKTDDHDALNVEIYGKIGQMKYRGQTILLECNWQ
jgi:hypothetical protein